MESGTKKEQSQFQVRTAYGYFSGWRGTKWDTIKRVATWADNVKQAVWITDQDLMELTCGYSNLVIRSRTKP